VSSTATERVGIDLEHGLGDRVDALDPLQLPDDYSLV
jgi:hypothetical protein